MQSKSFLFLHYTFSMLRTNIRFGITAYKHIVTTYTKSSIFATSRIIDFVKIGNRPDIVYESKKPLHIDEDAY